MLRRVSFKSHGHEAPVRRIFQLQSALKQKSVNIKWCSTNGKDQVISIGDVSMKIKPSNNRQYVPVKYVPEKVPQSVLKHLKWIMQKDLLGQDVFLIGPPGPLRRHIAMMYLEATQKEAEYVSLSRDTTETDLKQRREIRSGTAYHVDQVAVRAATEGRILVLEGIEKAERNVLPVLNNLLENREMQLDDGRFLMAADRYDKLLLDHSQKELDAWNLVRVSEDFRVIALGLPVPRYQGNPLDPPLRSRFQAREINPLPFKDQLEVLNAVSAGVSPERLSGILSFANTMRSTEATELGLPDFPIDNVVAIMKILSQMPNTSSHKLLHKLYPYDVMLNKEGQTAVVDALKSFELFDQHASTPQSQISEIKTSSDSVTVEITQNGISDCLKLKHGTAQNLLSSQTFASTQYHDDLLADMMQCHLVKDFCIIGPRGCGKSIVTREFADMLGYHIEPIMLYQDMTSRDLLQQRTTLPNGDTAWRPSPLVSAALDGSLAVLDGVHRVNAGTFAVLHRLIHDRELTLFDGTRLLRDDRYSAIKEKQNLSDEEMTNKGLLKIHPSFRILALAEPPVVNSSSQQWMNSELLTAFLYLNMRSLSPTEEIEVLKKLVPNMSDMDQILKITHLLRNSTDANLKSVAASLSTRQLLRIARRMSKYPEDNLYEVVEKACLARFLPRLTRSALDNELDKLEIFKKETVGSIDAIDKAMSCEINGGILRIGQTEVKVHAPETKMKVPDVLFYENPQHLSIMEDMLKDFLLGEHLLLVGNQGVGKNKIVDRFLYLLNRPREYLQLHRDTTVQTLTLQPTVQEGVIRYEDSPLVRAVKNGYILVIDEADKAPTNVTCILKTLVESGEMHLADGRRIVQANSGIIESSNVIVAHKDFRMIVLANRPGFPFLGNDFFGAMGDIFSCHGVDNPDMSSEMSMLRQYGPDVPEDILRKLVLAFRDLREMADQGQITYPYSTREVVNMVKHIQMFPDEGLAQVVKNVFDFDSYNKELKDTVIETLHKHGIPVGADPNNVTLAKVLDLPNMKWQGQIQVKGQGGKTKLLSCPIENRHMSIKGSQLLPVKSYPLERNEARSILFTEQSAYWTIPMHETAAIMDVAVSKALHRQPLPAQTDLIHILSVSPVSLYTMDPSKQNLTYIDFYDLFPHSNNKLRFKIAPLGFPLDSTVVVHEEINNTILNVNTETGYVSRVELASILEAATEKITRNFRQQQGRFHMCSDFCHTSDGMLIFYKEDSQSLDVVHMLEGRAFTIQVPIQISNVHMLSKDDWLLTETETKRLFKLSRTENGDYQIVPCNEVSVDNIDKANLFGGLQVAAKEGISDSQLSKMLNQTISSPNRILATDDTYVTAAVGMPDLSTVDIHSIPRTLENQEETDALKKAFTYHSAGNSQSARSRPQVVYLPKSGSIVRALEKSKIPADALHEDIKQYQVSGILEVSDAVNKKVRYVPVPGVENRNVYNQWFNSAAGPALVMAGMSEDGLVTVDSGGCVRLWETAMESIGDSLGNWRKMIGATDERKPLQMTIQREMGKVPTGPKHGKVDATGSPHVGGNQWAGGTGGRDTAGLGGVGGPYRLDAGHTVYQVPDAEKDAVPEEVRRAAREMGQKAFKERLKEIQMSEYDGELYERFSGNVQRQVKSLRVILDNLQAKGKERQWLKHQTHGDLDEAKLIEGLTGERAIYRRRGEKDPEMGSPQQKPKALKVLCDVSGSMYRFNGYDGRLEREMEAMVMVMEALDGYEHKIKYDIDGHSGEGFKFEMVKSSKTPKNNKHRLDVVKTLHAHSQFCISGDHTLEATEHAIKTLAEEKDVDERFVIVLSDANLDRYGIRPKRFADVLKMNDDVNAYVIFIGSLGNQANVLLKQMPSGHAFVCMDTKNLPQILQQIFTSTMLKT